MKNKIAFLILCAGVFTLAFGFGITFGDGWFYIILGLGLAVIAREVLHYPEKGG